MDSSLMNCCPSYIWALIYLVSTKKNDFYVLFNRLSDTNGILPLRTLAIETRKQNHAVADGRLFTNNQALEYPGLSETSVSPRKEFHLQNLDLANNGSTYSRGRTSTEIVFSTPMPSSPPCSRGNQYPTSPVRSRTFGQRQGSPTAWQDDSRSARSPQPLPLPPGSPCPPPGSPCPPSRSLQWKKGKLLGSGTFGQVYLGFNRCLV
jgi:mitogen-activated protein kinase kinase kinase 3